MSKRPEDIERLRLASTTRELEEAGVERALSLWPEWGFAFTHLDKGGSEGHPGIENRPRPPPQNLIGRRIAFHMGADIGGRKSWPATQEGIKSVVLSARVAGWTISEQYVKYGSNKCYVEMRKFDKVAELAVDGSGIVCSAITFTGVITGVDPPTPQPKHPWQIPSLLGGYDARSYAWHIEHVVVLEKPIPCGGMQGVWYVSAARPPRVGA